MGRLLGGLSNQNQAKPDMQSAPRLCNFATYFLSPSEAKEGVEDLWSRRRKRSQQIKTSAKQEVRFCLYLLERGVRSVYLRKCGVFLRTFRDRGSAETQRCGAGLKQYNLTIRETSRAEPSAATSSNHDRDKRSEHHRDSQLVTISFNHCLLELSVFPLGLMPWQTAIFSASRVCYSTIGGGFLY